MYQYKYNKKGLAQILKHTSNEEKHDKRKKEQLIQTLNKENKVKKKDNKLQEW